MVHLCNCELVNVHNLLWRRMRLNQGWVWFVPEAAPKRLEPMLVAIATYIHVYVHTCVYSTDQMQGIRQTCLPSRVNAFVSLYKPI